MKNRNLPPITVLGPRWTCHLHRILHNGKITLVCFALTVVVLRGNLDAGKFGMSTQDLEKIWETFYHYKDKHIKPCRLLEEVQAPVVAEEMANNNYVEFDTNKLFMDEGEEEKIDPNKPYILEWNIFDWDEQSGEWISPKWPDFGPNSR